MLSYQIVEVCHLHVTSHHLWLTSTSRSHILNMTDSGQANTSVSMPAQIGFNLDDITKKKVENSNQAVNRLPPELLSRIFAIGDGEIRNKRVHYHRYYGFQDLAIVSL